MWPSIRAFLNIPENLTGKGVNIAVIDSSFAQHPDITSNRQRNTYLIQTSEPDTQPVLLQSNEGPWNKGLHGLWSATAAAGSGMLSNGFFTGAAPDANLYLLQTGSFYTSNDAEEKIGKALEWLKANWRSSNIRGVVLTVTATRDTGLLPWQADPVRILCEELMSEGLLIVSSSGNTKELTCDGPSASPSVLSVGGVIVPVDGDALHAQAYHGCRGNTFDNKWVPEILAPAGNVVLPMPFQSEEERLHHYTASYDNLPDGYARTEGTSYSGPIILGAAACIWQVNPLWSAAKVKEAILRSSTHSPHVWNELRSGLVNVSAAVNMNVSFDDEGFLATTPFLLWKSWKEREHTESLAALRSGDEEETLAALFSYFSEPLSIEMFHDIHPLLQHSSYKIRAAAIILLSECPETISIEDLRPLFKDTSSYVRMGVLYACGKCPDLWEQLLIDIAALFSDMDSDIQYASLTLAAQVKHPFFISPIIAGLMDDAVNQRVSTFSQRCHALEQITGIQFDSEPEWREGQCWYSARSTETRVGIARKWIAWQSS
ncbi:S8 family serine peptidase [Paenibacillus radicis (ex Gao et al. 2016)]|nr:S8 family serine peptidase [Paenibacillus radicis (ex Gao et al. 2016)]